MYQILRSGVLLLLVEEMYLLSNNNSIDVDQIPIPNISWRRIFVF
jgi:hypothetical protein